MKVFSQCANCGDMIEGGDHIYFVNERAYCSLYCFAQSEYIRHFSAILTDDSNITPLFILDTDNHDLEECNDEQ